MKSRAAATAFVRNLDSRAMPRYSFYEAASYLGLPESTIRSWFAGMPYGSAPNIKRQEPILIPASKELLSFYDIASAHVLMAMKAGGAAQGDLREIVRGLQREYPDSPHPLLGRDFYMFGRDVVLRKMKILLNMTRGRQLGMKGVMNKFLARIELDANLMPVRFSPLRTHRERGKGYIVIDPDFAYGRPVIKGTGIAAEIVAKRKGSGESEARLAKDYRISLRAVKEAVKHFPQQKAA
ncbi:MAG TPA: DUF433 domain-containing protein [Terracidiphilus sp.]|nr:DUF433 domain-containing protein [Terracidiphilus sp.]